MDGSIQTRAFRVMLWVDADAVGIPILGTVSQPAVRQRHFLNSDLLLEGHLRLEVYGYRSRRP